jgi:hypothetical protein
MRLDTRHHAEKDLSHGQAAATGRSRSRLKHLLARVVRCCPGHKALASAWRQREGRGLAIAVAVVVALEAAYIASGPTVKTFPPLAPAAQQANTDG